MTDINQKQNTNLIVVINNNVPSASLFKFDITQYKVVDFHLLRIFINMQKTFLQNMVSNSVSRFLGSFEEMFIENWQWLLMMKYEYDTKKYAKNKRYTTYSC